MALQFNKFWKTYELKESEPQRGTEYYSDSFDDDTTRWEIISTQVFEFRGKLFLSVLWKTDSQLLS
jgi:hypothetical protein